MNQINNRQCTCVITYISTILVLKSAVLPIGGINEELK